MITAEISVVPIGTSSTSVSDFVAEAGKVLQDYPQAVSKLTGMGTEIQCQDAGILFEILQKMHSAPFNKDVKRVYTVIKIDDRKDKEASLEQKISSVKAKL